MLCENPFMAGIIPYPCRKCLPCRVARRRKWATRQVFESLTHEHNAFVTLTYSEQYLQGNYNLYKQDLKAWLKRLRFAITPLKIRFFACGEYGDLGFMRPHFHVSVFGASPLLLTGKRIFADQVDAAWGHGYVQCAEFNASTAAYVCGYVTKKLDKKISAAISNRPPEFAHGSRRPGIGKLAMLQAAKMLLNQAQSWRDGDVPHSFLMGRKKISLDSYLLKQLRDAVGFEDEFVSELKKEVGIARSLELLSLPKNSSPLETYKTTFLDSIVQKLRQVEARERQINSARRISL